MAYSVVPTVITGDSWTAGNNNTYVRDNFKAGIPDIFTSQGDLAFATGANVAAPFPIGTAHKRLMMNNAGTLPEWKGIIGCSISDTVRAGVSTSPTIITFNTENYDTNNFWDASNDDAVIIPFNGVYHISGIVVMTVDDAGATELVIVIGPSDKTILSIKPPPAEDRYIPYNYVGYFESGNDVYLKVSAYPYGVSGSSIKSLYHNVRYLGTYL